MKKFTHIVIFLVSCITACNNSHVDGYKIYDVIQGDCGYEALEKYKDYPLETMLHPKARVHPLASAVVTNDLECVKKVHKLFGGINYPSSDEQLGHTPLFFAVTTGVDEAIEEYLIKNGADESIRDTRGNTVGFYRSLIKKMVLEERFKRHSATK